MKNKIRIFLTAIGVAVSGLGFAGAAVKTTVKSADAASSYNCVMNINGYVGAKYCNEGNNPDSWAGLSGNSSQGKISFNKLTATSFSQSGTQMTFASGCNYKLTNLSSSGTNRIDFTELEYTHNCTGLYFPVCVYLTNIPAYTLVNTTIRFDLTITGGSNACYASAQYFHFGVSDTPEVYNSTAGYTYIAQNATYLPTVSTGISTGSNGTSSTGSYTLNLTGDNRTGSTALKRAAYGALFVGARKDSSASHKISGSLGITITNYGSETQYAAKTNDDNYYSKVSDAFSYVSTGGTVTLLKDYTASVTPTANKNMTFNLNGHTLTSTLTVSNTGNLTLAGTGTIKQSYNTAIINNAGTLTIPSGVVVQNNGTTSQSIAVSNTGTLNCAGTLSSYGYAIKADGGNTYISGGSLTSTNGSAITLVSGNMYISGTPTISSHNSYDIYKQSAGTLYGANATGSTATFYTGSKLVVKLSTLPSENENVVVNCQIGKFEIENATPDHYEFIYDSTSRCIKYKYYSTYTVTYYKNAGDATGTTVDSNQYRKDDMATILGCGFTYKYHTFVNWNTASNGGGASYQAGQTYKIGVSSVVLYAQWTQTAENEADELAESKLRMNTYDADLDNSEATGLCKTQYAVAKSKYIYMQQSAKALFGTDAKYANARNRFQAWANANGESIDFETYQFTALSSNVMEPANNQTSMIIAIVALTAFLAAGVVLFIRKKQY